MKSIELLKLKTREDALYPQEEKYPSGTIVSKGLMWKWTIPEVGKQFNVMYDKLTPIFHTSTITNIIETTEDKIIFETVNSLYQINILKDKY